MTRLKILHVTPYAAEAWAYGGIPRIAATLAREQAREGHDVTICTTDVCDATSRLTATPSNGAARLRAWAPTRTADGVEVHVFPNVSNRAAYHWQAFAPIGLASYLRQCARTFDVAHLHACRNLPGALAAHYLRCAGVPFVVAPNGTAPILERRRFAKRVFDLAAGDRLLRTAASVIAVSHAETRQLADLGVPSSSVRLVPNPIDLDEFAVPPARGRFRERFGLGSNPVVLFLGKLTPRKRLDVLAAAFARLGPSGADTARLVIAGNDMGAGAETRRIVRELGVEGRTLFTGLLRGRDRLEALADADVVVYPSEHEIFGLVPLEALLAGTPVIVADDSGCGEVVGASGGGQVVPLGDVPALAHAVERVLQAPDEWRAEASRAAVHVRNTYGAATIAARVTDVYRSALGRAPESATRSADGVSFVIPIHNGARWIREVIGAIGTQDHGRPFEILAVDDRSDDGSAAIVQECAAAWPVRLLQGYGRGAAAAINTGIRAARFPLIAQVDQDVVIRSGWTARLAGALDDPTIAAAQGYYTTDRRATWCARATGFDLEARYAAMHGSETDQACTGNVIYRAEALHRVGLFDERLGYGYDNDMSYRLRDAGYRLTMRRNAESVHCWRDGLVGYCAQQYGLGYGRIDLVFGKHPHRFTGDKVSPRSMMLHPIAMAGAVACVAVALMIAVSGGPWRAAAVTATAVVAVLGLERLIVGCRSALRFRDAAPLSFVWLHLVRDLVWVAAMTRWSVRRAFGHSSQPSDSMRRGPISKTSRAVGPVPTRVLALILAHNEAASLPAVVAEIRKCRPDLDLLIVDDGSTDETRYVIERLGTRWLRLPERTGIGSAMRAGLLYATRLGYDSAVRVDGDGQHRAEDIDRLIAPLLDGRADVVMGSRFATQAARGWGAVGLLQRALSVCLSVLTGKPVTDPTSGFCALGPVAVRLLVDHHPTGYPEPELRLLLSRNGLTSVEVPVESRPRLAGRTSLTPGRVTAAGARVLLAMIVVPLRGVVGRLHRD